MGKFPLFLINMKKSSVFAPYHLHKHCSLYCFAYHIKKGVGASLRSTFHVQKTDRNTHFFVCFNSYFLWNYIIINISYIYYDIDQTIHLVKIIVYKFKSFFNQISKALCIWILGNKNTLSRINSFLQKNNTW